MKKLFSVLLALIWFGTANHCFIMDAFAAKLSGSHNCCEDSKKTGGTHDRSSGKVCCELFVQNDQNSSDSLTASPNSLLPILVVVGRAEYLNPLQSVEVSKVIVSNLPPDPIRSFLIALLLAPNAPPLLS